jgi:hypothetical protein
MRARWRAWLQRGLTRSVAPTPAQARQDRAETIAALWREVRQLQQAIKEATDALDHQLPGEARQRQAQQLAALERQLAQTQQELARYQARV